MTVPTFRELCEKAARRGCRGLDRPKTLTDLANMCGISRSHFYNLLCGTKGISDDMLISVAEGLGETQTDVRASIARTRMLASLDF